jgi:hypothetical protein
LRSTGASDSVLSPSVAMPPILLVIAPVRPAPAMRGVRKGGT